MMSKSMAPKLYDCDLGDKYILTKKKNYVIILLFMLYKIDRIFSIVAQFFLFHFLMFWLSFNTFSQEYISYKL